MLLLRETLFALSGAAGYAWRTMFLDETKVHVKGGDGGAGIVAFRREKYVPLGGPAGGDGGKGGAVVLLANPRLHTLSYFERKKHFKAPRGPGEQNTLFQEGISDQSSDEG